MMTRNVINYICVNMFDYNLSHWNEDKKEYDWKNNNGHHIWFIY